MRCNFFFLAVLAVLSIVWGLTGGCGEVMRQTETFSGAIDPNVTPSEADSRLGTLAVLASDFVGGAITVFRSGTVIRNLETTHSDAVLRSYGGRLYVINRLNQDNVQVIDPAADYKTVAQWSLGRRTNPHDIYVTEAGIAYVSLYEPERNTDTDIVADDMVILNPLTGARLGVLDLSWLAADDGDRHPRVSSLLAVPNSAHQTLLYAALQDLPSDLGLRPDSPGKIAIMNIGDTLDRATLSVAGSISLQCRDPVALAYSGESRRLYVSCADFFDLSSPWGGIEVVDLDQRQSGGIWISDEVLGGAPGDIEVTKGFGFVTVGFAEPGSRRFMTKVIRFADQPSGPPQLKPVYSSKGFIQDLAIAADGTVVIGDRWPEVAGLLFFNPETLTEVRGVVATGLPPSSIAVVP